MFEDSVNNTDIAENERWFETFWRWIDGWMDGYFFMTR